MKFTKMHGCGNDYIYVNCFEEKLADPAGAAVRLSDRHYGIGGDGLILIEPSGRADAYMHMFNRDGSEGSMCGNGIRCVAKYIYNHRLIPAGRSRAVIDTKAGIREVDLKIEDGLVRSVTVDMGKLKLIEPEGNQLNVDGREIGFMRVDAGNPHAVIFAEENDDSDLLQVGNVGPVFEASPLFGTEGTNTEVVRVISPREILMRVWERGSGETLACGTGAAAAVFAGICSGRLEDEVTVHLAGGDLFVRWDKEAGHCFLEGPAEEVFSGEVKL